MLKEVARGLHWVCLGVARSLGLRPVSGRGLGHLGSISGAFWRLFMDACVCQRGHCWVCVAVSRGSVLRLASGGARKILGVLGLS